MIAGVEAAAAYCGCGHAESQFSARPEFSLGIVHLGRGGGRLLPLRHEAAVVDPLSGRVCHDGHVIHRPERAGDDAGLRRGDIRRLVADETGLLTGRRQAHRRISPSPATCPKGRVSGGFRTA